MESSQPYALETKQILHHSWSFIRSQQQDANLSQQELMQQRTKLHEYKLNDLVLLRNQKPDVWDKRWLGPYRLVKKHDPTAWDLQDKDAPPNSPPKHYNVAEMNLKPVFERHAIFQVSVSNPCVPTIVSLEELRLWWSDEVQQYWGIWQ